MLGNGGHSLGGDLGKSLRFEDWLQPWQCARLKEVISDFSGICSLQTDYEVSPEHATKKAAEGSEHSLSIVLDFGNVYSAMDSCAKLLPPQCQRSAQWSTSQAKSLPPKRQLAVMHPAEHLLAVRPSF